MQIQINTDNHVQGDERLAEHAQERIRDQLGRFGERITRVEVHFSDENSAVRATGNDKRCALEARLAGLQPVAVTHQAPTVREALEGALDKAVRVLNDITETERARERRPG